jgi:hypothetical protein
MQEIWSIVMVISGALFIAGVLPIAYERAPVWREADDVTFRTEFARTLRRVDRLQPALLLISLIGAVGFAVSGGGTARILAVAAALCLVAVLIGSGLALVPIQRRLIDPGTNLSTAEAGRLRGRWLKGHLIRTVVSLLAFVLLVVAAVI